MRVLWLLALTAVVAMTSRDGVAQTQPEVGFVGSWKVAERTGGLTAATISTDGTVQIWGQCTPADCPWGAAKFNLVPDALRKLPVRGFAAYDNGRYVIFRLEGQDLFVESYSVPAKQSGAGNPRAYFGIQRLVRDAKFGSDQPVDRR